MKSYLYIDEDTLMHIQDAVASLQQAADYCDNPNFANTLRDLADEAWGIREFLMEETQSGVDPDPTQEDTSVDPDRRVPWHPLAEGADETCSYPCGNPAHSH